MKSYQKGRIITVIFGMILILGLFSFNAKAQDGPPAPEDAFNGHTFDENYWDTDVFNNSNWDHPEVRPEVSWEDNTWNIKSNGEEFRLFLLSNSDEIKDIKPDKRALILFLNSPSKFNWKNADKYFFQE